MRRRLGLLLAWTLAAGMAGLEALTAWAWLRGTRYVMRCGAEADPYAAEDAEIAGICALLLLPLVLAALAAAVYGTILWCKDRAGARSER